MTIEDKCRGCNRCTLVEVGYCKNHGEGVSDEDYEKIHEYGVSREELAEARYWKKCETERDGEN